jgi:hypothetical protein
MTISRLMELCGQMSHTAAAGSPEPVTPYAPASGEPLSRFSLEKRDAFLVDRHMGAGARIASGPGGTMLDRKSTEPPQLDPVAACQGRDDFIEDRIHNVLHIPLVKVRVVLGDTLNEFGFDHRNWDPGACGYAFP